MKTSKSITSALLIGTLAFWFASALFVEAAGAAALAARTSDAEGVRVEVTPKLADSGAAVWEFEVVMDTHSKELSTDLAQTAVLTDDTGRDYAPIAWQGDPPGGHHREGILQFPPPAGNPKSVELKIKDIGGVSERIFRWELD